MTELDMQNKPLPSMAASQHDEPCLFPILNDSTAGPCDDASVLEIEASIVKAALHFCRRTQTNVAFFMAGVWAVILGEFTDVERVHMMLGYCSLDDEKNLGKERLAEMYTVWANLGGEKTMGALFRPEHWTVLPWMPTDTSAHNTGIVLDVTMHEPLRRGASAVQTASRHATPLSKVCETCPILLVVRDAAESCSLELRYRGSILSHEHAQLLRSSIAHVIASALQNPSTAPREISLSDDARQQQQIRKWNAYPIPRILCSSMYEIVQQHARSHPGKQAVHAWDGCLTFHELNSLSDQLAVHLTYRQVGVGAMVPVCFEKSVWAIVAMLAVNKTGAAFVPLEPSLPSSRLENIAMQTNASIIITSVQQAPILKGVIAKRVIVSRPMIESLGASKPRVYKCPAAQPDDPAYCLFTSGSTGQPKGCLVGHGALANVAVHSRKLRIGQDSRVLQFASFSFGISLIEIWCTLTAGGTVCVPSAEDRANRLQDVINNMQINWALMTPTTIQVLCPQQVPCLRTVAIAGEPITKAQLDIWADAVHLFQAYGLTEWAGICGVAAQACCSAAATSNIGTSAGGKFWLVDPAGHNRLAPIGAEAELLIEGPCLARGYLNQPDETAARFISSPPWMAAVSGDDDTSSSPRRLYKTGDIVRYNCDGSISYLSRKGTSVKLRGQRIELGEVEYHIVEAAGTLKKAIAEIVVPLGGDGSSVLAAFILPQQQPSLDGERKSRDTDESWFVAADEQLRNTILGVVAQLQKRLPSYMVPSIFMPIRQLPVTVSGKVDRRRLRESVGQHSRKDLNALTMAPIDFREPGSKAENVVCRLTAEILNLPPEQVGMDHSFLQLGGDSVSAIKLVELARRHQLSLNVGDILRHPKLADLAQTVDLGTRLGSAFLTPAPFQLVSGDDGQREQLLLVASTQCGIPTSEIEDVYPCTPTQEDLMGLSAIRVGAGVARFTYKLRKDVDLPQFKAAWNAILDENPILRTRIVQSACYGMLQVVLYSDSFEWDDDLKVVGDRPMGLGQRLLAAAMAADAQHPTTPLFVVTIHHALCDRFSMQTIMRQVDQVYRNGETATPTPSFGSFVAYSCSARDEPSTRMYWESQFHGLDAEAFPAISATSSPVADSAVDLHVRLPGSVAGGHTMSTLLRMAWAIVVMHHTSCDDVVFGSTVSGRGATVAGMDQMTGPTIANVPLCIRLQPEKTIEATLMQIHQQALEMMPFEQAGIHNIQQFSEEAKAGCRFQSHLVVQPPWENPVPALWSQCHADSVAPGGFSATALVLMCSLGRERHEMDIAAQFDGRVLDAEHVRRLLRHLDAVLQEAVLNPQQRIRDLSPLGALDVWQLKTWSARATVEASESCAHHLIETQCVQQPEGPAVSSWDGQLTYEELDHHSRRLSMRLETYGVGPDQFVPICLHKSKWTVVAMLAVMKAGGAFVLLDPAHPVSRLRYVCEQVYSRVVISSEELSSLTDSFGRSVVYVELEESMGKDEGVNRFHKLQQVQPHHALYAVFTSGSTGTPKGVIIEHRSFCSSALAHNSLHKATRGSRVLQFASYAFDICIMEMLSTLVAGGCVCVLSESERRDDFFHAAKQHQITHAFLTPSILRSLNPARLASLKVLAVGGEAMLPADVASLGGQHFSLVNEYGPAECSITSTVNDQIRTSSNAENIGFPVGCRCWIVDPRNHERLVPIGAVGELVVEGPIVGRGYLNDPDKTAAQFVQSPVWLQKLYPDAHMPSRLYKTGDLAKHHTDGSILYVGRKDRQVKLRGQRLELSEVESHLLSCFPGARAVVAEVVVLQGQKTPSLVAFVVDQAAGPIETEQRLIKPPNDPFYRNVQLAEDALRSRVPSFMIPAVFLPLGEVPCTVTGKINRRVLRVAAEEMAADEVQRHRAGAASKRTSWTPMLIKLQAIWAAALRLELDAVGGDDNFFHLGGDSITAMNVVARLQDCGLHLTVANIFSHPKLAEQALVISESREEPGGSVPAPFSLLGDSAQRLLQAAAEQCQVSAATIEDMYPCTPLQEGFLALTARDPAAYVGQWMYDLPERLDVSRLRQAWERTAEAHPILRTRFAQVDARNVYQVVVRGASVPWDVWDHVDGNAADVRHGMDLGQPPFHVGIVTRSAQKNQQLGLLLTMHHAMYDANSIRQILRNVDMAYHSQTDLVHRPFSPFIQYLGSEAPRHEDYWRRDLAHLQATPFPTLPSARYRPSPSSLIQHRVVLGQSRATNFTASTKIHLAWALVQSQYQLADDVVFGITVSGRSAPVLGISTMTGPTIATIPLRLVLEKEESLDALLQQTQNKRIAFIPHEHAGLQNIRKWGSDAGMACSFQTLLVVQQENGDDDTVGPDMFTLAKSLTDWTAFSNYALTICCNVLQGSVVEFQVSFDSQVVPEQQMHRIMGAFAETLQEINTSSARPLKELRSLRQSEYEELMTRNSEVPPILDCSSIWDSIQHHCIHAPNTVAVCAWDGDFTYGELDSLCSDLARHLVSRGVSQETAVSLYFEKSRWTTVAMLAVIKSGGFFVLLDPSHPFQRHESISRQINAQAMLVSELHDDAAAPLCDDRIVVGDSHRSWGGVQEVWRPPQTRHDHALYVVFTSGSTGEPRGVVIEHGSYRASADAHVQSFNLTNSSRMLQFATYAAAASVVEILSTLMVGGCVCVLSDAQRRDGFVDAVRCLQPSHALLTPEFARSISDPDQLTSLRTLVLAGDKATAADVAQWRDKVRLVNAYGPAECSAVAVVQDHMDRNTHPSNIGFGSGSICWVVDPQDTNRLVPIGAPGELLIEGPLVARGYLNDPVRTAATFISPPPWLQALRQGKPSRLYRTGDLVKYHTDGSLIFVGRKQEKLQRQRVELSKVEHHVQRSVAGAAEVVVELVESHGQALLFAFALCENLDKNQQISNAPDPDPAQLFQTPSERFGAATLAGEAKLRESIPHYMVPAVYIPLARMPHTITGKADRQRLRDEASILSPSQVQAYQSSKVNAKKQHLPLTEHEEILQGLWAEVLGVSPSSIQASDHFFHLGGDSIVAMKLASLVRDAGMQLTVADVFDTPRLCDQAVRLRSLPQKDEGVHPFALSKVEAPQQYFAQLKVLGLAPAQSEMVDLIPATEAQSFFTRRRTLHHFTFSLTGQVDEQRLRDSCSAVMEKHSILRTLFAVHEGQLAQVMLQKAELPFRHLTDISDLATFQQSLWETDATGNEIVPGLPTKFFLLSDADARRHALIIRLTHAQWDGVCISVLFNDMAKVYNGGQITPTTDFPAYLYLRAQQPRNDAFSFWRQLLHGSTVTPLASSSVSSRQISRGTTIWKDQWISPAPEPPAGITTATLIKAAWAHVLAQTTSQTDIVFGQTVNSRSLPLAHIDTIVGPCLNFIPVRVQMHPSSTIRDFLSHIQAQHTQSMRHDYLELPEIAQHCTSWPAGTEFGSIVQHQNFGTDTNLPLDGLDTEFSLRASFNPVGELWFFTYPMTAKLLVQVCVSRNAVSEKRALELLDKLCMTIQAFATSPDRRLSDVA